MTDIRKINADSIQKRRERRDREQLELDAALAEWVKFQSRANTEELYRKARAYLGIAPVVPD